MKYASALVSLGLILVFVGSGFAADAPRSACHFGPAIKILFQNHSENSCKGSAKIQGLLWECATAADIQGRVDSIKTRLNELARNECKKHCLSFGKKCGYTFTAAQECGLKTGLEGALEMGRKYGCRQDCTGKAFSFCSIYDAGFRLEDVELLSRQEPNCHCAPKR